MDTVLVRSDRMLSTWLYPGLWGMLHNAWSACPSDVLCLCVGTPAYFHGLLPDELSCSYWQVPQGMPVMNGMCSISISFIL